LAAAGLHLVAAASLRSTPSGMMARLPQVVGVANHKGFPVVRPTFVTIACQCVERGWQARRDMEQAGKLLPSDQLTHARFSQWQSPGLPEWVDNLRLFGVSRTAKSYLKLQKGSTLWRVYDRSLKTMGAGIIHEYLTNNPPADEWKEGKEPHQLARQRTEHAYGLLQQVLIHQVSQGPGAPEALIAKIHFLGYHKRADSKVPGSFHLMKDRETENKQQFMENTNPFRRTEGLVPSHVIYFPHWLPPPARMTRATDEGLRFKVEPPAPVLARN